ncbi:MAG: hypothetical protein ABIT10_05050 [Alteraurantiacibacter sp.]
MIYLYATAAVGGIAALALVPHHRDRTHRLMERGGAAALFGVGLFGALTMLVVR